MLTADGIKPILSTICINITCGFAETFIGKPIWALPTEFFTETRALCRKPCVKRRLSTIPNALMFFMWPCHCVVLRISLKRARPNPIHITMWISESPNIYNPQVIWRDTAMHPLGKRHTSTAPSGDTKRIEPSADEKVFQFGCFAENKVSVWCETLGAIC